MRSQLCERKTEDLFHKRKHKQSFLNSCRLFMDLCEDKGTKSSSMLLKDVRGRGYIQDFKHTYHDHRRSRVNQFNRQNMMLMLLAQSQIVFLKQC